MIKVFVGLSFDQKTRLILLLEQYKEVPEYVANSWAVIKKDCLRRCNKGDHKSS